MPDVHGKRCQSQRCYNTGQVIEMKKKILQTLGLAVLTLTFLLAMFTAMASAPLPQAVIATPTPRADGRIVYIVKENDTCISIALTMGISETELRDLNNLQGDACQAIYPGQELLIGIKEEETPTATPEVPLEPTPTPIKGNGTICIYLFIDENGNALAGTGELPLAGGAVSVTDRLGNINETGTTTDSGEAVCFPDIPEGDYNLSVAIPEGYNPTTVMNYALTLGAGEISTVDFGAQPGSALRPAFGDGGRPSPLLLVLGFVFIGAGIGLWFYVRRMAQ